LVEDSPADALLIRETLTEHRIDCDLMILKDGEAALRYLDELEGGSWICPDLVILDLNLPKKSGYEVLQRIRASKRCRFVPVVVLSSSSAPADKARALSLGSTRYITKPTLLEDFIQIGVVFQELLGPRP
jgi:DNA-binding response OmpR family regulator